MELPKKLKIDYIKNNGYRTIHADGANGGLTPDLNVFLSFWLQRGAIPDATVHEVMPDGRFSGLPSETLGKSQVVREIDFGIVMTLDVARQVQEWLSEQIKQAEKLRKGSASEVTTQ